MWSWRGNLAQASRFYKEMISVLERDGFPFGVPAGLTGLARVALARGELADARETLLRALKSPPISRTVQHTIEAIAIMTELRQAEGQWKAAAELCAALLSWPAMPLYAPQTLRHLRAELEARLQMLAAQLPPEVFAAAAARGRSRQVEEVVAEIAKG